MRFNNSTRNNDEWSGHRRSSHRWTQPIERPANRKNEVNRGRRAKFTSLVVAVSGPMNPRKTEWVKAGMEMRRPTQESTTWEKKWWLTPCTAFAACQLSENSALQTKPEKWKHHKCNKVVRTPCKEMNGKYLRWGRRFHYWTFGSPQMDQSYLQGRRRLVTRIVMKMSFKLCSS